MAKNRSLSLSMVVLVLLAILLMQSEISYSTTFGGLDSLTTETRRSLATGWLVFRVALILVLIVLWILNRKKHLFKAIIFANGVLTIGLLMNMTALTDVLVGISIKAANVLPLTRRAKMLMLLQSAVSIITLTGIAGSAINILAGAN